VKLGNDLSKGCQEIANKFTKIGDEEEIKGYSYYELSIKIGHLRYDSILNFFESLPYNHNEIVAIKSCINTVSKMWDISKKYMKI
jgi:hypothetical protein